MIKKKAPAINHPAAISIFSPPDANEPSDMVVTKQNIDGSTLLQNENLQLAVIELNICPQHSKTISKEGVMIIHLPKGLIILIYRLDACFRNRLLSVKSDLLIVLIHTCHKTLPQALVAFHNCYKTKMSVLFLLAYG